MRTDQPILPAHTRVLPAHTRARVAKRMTLTCPHLSATLPPLVKAQYETFAGQDELRYTGFTPNEPVGCH